MGDHTHIDAPLGLGDHKVGEAVAVDILHLCGRFPFFFDVYRYLIPLVLSPIGAIREVGILIAEEGEPFECLVLERKHMVGR